MSRCVHLVVYVSGPVTCKAEDNRPAFEQAARKLRAAGYSPHIPHADVAPGNPWVAAMRTCLMSMLAQADGVALRRAGSSVAARASRSAWRGRRACR